MEWLFIFLVLFGVGCVLGIMFGLLGWLVAISKAIIVNIPNIPKIPSIIARELRESREQSDRQIQQFDERLKRWEAKINHWTERIRQDGDARRARWVQRFRVRQANRQ